MPFGEVKLIPGVNVERTATLYEAGISQSQLIRFKDGLAQKLGGWRKFYSFAVSGVPRDLHAWEDLNQAQHLGVGTTTQLSVITAGNLKDITPQTLTTNPAPNFTTTGGSPVVTVTDANISNVTVFDSVLFNTPVAVDGIILSGLYAITQIVSTHVYEITAATNATSGVMNMGAVPVFTSTSGSSSLRVTLAANGLSIGSSIVFPISTTGNGVTIFGDYTVTALVDANNFDIVVGNQASASGAFSMNGGNCQFVYYINLGPPATGAGYGSGTYGSGGYGTGTSTSGQTGVEITATDWSQDNWGEILLACPQNGGVYSYDPTGGFTNAGLIATAPPFNGGLFVSVSQQILICWGSTTTRDIGIQQDPMLVAWSDVGNFANFIQTVSNQAGNFRIPIGSAIRGGAAVSSQDLIWTDLDLWAMNYLGPPDVFGFNKIGAGAGLISSHAAQQLRGNVYWMGPTNFYSTATGAVAVLPCSVWDFVFQNLNPVYVQNVRCMPNTPYNEAGWAFPSMASVSGENDCYVKMNITDPGAPWDFGPTGALPRSAWIDQTVLGTPIGASPGGLIYQHETSNDADGQPLMASFTTGYFYLTEGEEFVFIDQILPDFKWGFYGAGQTAQIQLTINVVNFPGDSPVAFGPYLVTQSTEIVSVRIRGRQASITVASSDVGSFWRLGKVRFRYSPMGRR